MNLIKNVCMIIGIGGSSLSSREKDEDKYPGDVTAEQLGWDLAKTVGGILFVAAVIAVIGFVLLQ